MNMKYLSFIVCCLFFTGLSAQTTRDTVPPYKKNPLIPAFSILQTDSTVFTKDELPKYDYTAIIYFSPDCGHCQYTVAELIKKMDSLRNVFFVFVAFKSVPEIKEFYEHYDLARFPNIRMGRDTKYFIPSFYYITYTPFVAIYNRQGTLVKVYDPPNRPVMEVPELVALVNAK